MPIWAKDGRRLHESQMRRWQSVVPPDMMEATWGQLPSPPRMGRSWTLREGLVRAIAAATTITALAKVEIWNPYTIDVHKMGPVKSSGLRIRRRTCVRAYVRACAFRIQPRMILSRGASYNRNPTLALASVPELTSLVDPREQCTHKRTIAPHAIAPGEKTRDAHTALEQ